MSRHDRHRPDNRRASIANEAARLIQEQGLSDYRAAKTKALERLGLRSGVRLPSNEEIEFALAERNRIFHGDQHQRHVRALRRVALQVMQSLRMFDARLVGAALSGNVTQHSTIDLHVFSDAPEAVAARLDAMGIRYRPAHFRHRFKPRQSAEFPGFRFVADDFECAATVFTEKRRPHPPLSPVDGRPMRRGSIRDVERLVSDAGC